MSRKVRIRAGFEGGIEPLDAVVPDREPDPWGADAELRVVGTRRPRLDAVAKVTGSARYTFDVNLPGMLHARVLRCPHPAAKIVAVDATRVRAHPGVEAVLTFEGSIARFAGEEVAAVAAVSPEAASEALALFEASYEPLPWVTDLDRARDPQAPAVFGEEGPPGAQPPSQGDLGETRAQDPADASPTQDPAGRTKGAPANVRPANVRERGDAAAALASAERVVDATFRTQVQTHACLETHGVVARWEPDGDLTVWASTQATFSVRDEIADALGLARPKVHVITEHMGGGFGSKFGAGSFSLIAARLAKEAKAPVKLMLTRREEHLGTGNRPSAVMRLRAAAKADGTLTALHLVSYGTAGIGTGAGVSGPIRNIYDVPNVRTEETDVFTNTGPGAPMRAPGHPQGSFALEQTLDMMAEKCGGMDPLAFRKKNDTHPVRLSQYAVGAKAIGWAEKRAAFDVSNRDPRGGPVKRGIGMGSAVWYNTGGPGATVQVRVARDGSVEVRNGAQDIGTGTTTAVGMMAAEVLGVPVETVTVRLGRTDWPEGPGSGGSTTTPTLIPAVGTAAREAIARLGGIAARALGVRAEEIDFEPVPSRTRESISARPGEPGRAGGSRRKSGGPSDGGRDRAERDAGWPMFVVRGDRSRRLTWAEAAAKVPVEGLTVQGSRAEDYAGLYEGKIAGVQFVEIEVDVGTGKIRVVKVVAVQDCGRVINPLLAESQINGGVIQGLSYALFEDRLLDPPTGRMVNANLEQYKIAGSLDVPEIVAIPHSVAMGFNSAGVLGIGEPPVIPTAGAIANAFAHATGRRLFELPMTPARVLDLLGREGGQHA